MSVEAIGAAAQTAGALWAGVSDFVPPIPKAIGSAVVTGIGAVGAFKIWQNKRREKREERKS